MQPAFGLHAAVRFLSFPWAGTGEKYLKWVKNRNPDLVCEKDLSLCVLFRHSKWNQLPLYCIMYLGLFSLFV